MVHKKIKDEQFAVLVLVLVLEYQYSTALHVVLFVVCSYCWLQVLCIILFYTYIRRTCTVPERGWCGGGVVVVVVEVECRREVEVEVHTSISICRRSVGGSRNDNEQIDQYVPTYGRLKSTRICTTQMGSVIVMYTYMYVQKQFGAQILVFRHTDTMLQLPYYILQSMCHIGNYNLLELTEPQLCTLLPL